MNLRLKTLFSLSIVFIVFIFIIFFFSKEFLVEGIEKLEREKAYEEIDKIVNIFHSEISRLDETNYDWAAWDDTYKFIEDKNQEYIESNLVNSTFTALDINFMLYFNSTGYLVYGKAFDLENNTEIEIPESLLEYIKSHPHLIYHKYTNSSVAGIAVVDNKIFIISSRPILTSNDEGPIRGALIMSKYFNEEQILELENLTGIPLSVHIVSEAKKEKSIKIIDKNLLAVYEVIKDIDGKPAIVFEAILERDVYNHGLAFIHYFMLLFIIMAVLTLLISFILFESTVTSKIVGLCKEVNEIARSKDITKRIKKKGEDEIGKLIDSINVMLDSIEDSHRKIKELLEKEREMKTKIAHYFFNPIAIAKGYLQLMEKEEKIEKAINAINRIEKVVKNIVKKGKIEE